MIKMAGKKDLWEMNVKRGRQKAANREFLSIINRPRSPGVSKYHNFHNSFWGQKFYILTPNYCRNATQIGLYCN